MFLKLNNYCIKFVPTRKINVLSFVNHNELKMFYNQSINVILNITFQTGPDFHVEHKSNIHS